MRWGDRCPPPPHCTPVPTPAAYPPPWASVLTISGWGQGVHQRRWRLITPMLPVFFLVAFAVSGSRKRVRAIYRLYRRSAMPMSGLDMWDDETIFEDLDVLNPSHTPTPPALPEGATALLSISDEEVCVDDHVEDPDVPDAVPRQSGNKRRKVTKSSFPAMQTVTAKSSMSVTCMFIPEANSKKKNLVAVALWPQYEIALPGLSADPSRWVVVGNYESWFLQLTKHISTGSLRCNAQFFKNVFKPIFAASMRKARARMVKNKLPDDSGSEEEDDHDPNDEKCLRIPFHVHPCLRVTMGEFTVTCLNNGRVCVLQVDDECIKFILGFLLPLAETKWAHSQSGAATPQEHEKPTAAFSFSTSCTPNIRDKVSWEPVRHGWKLSIKKPRAKLQPFTDQSGKSLLVDPLLDLAVYAAEKKDKYLKAIETWNAVDGSSRDRIPATPSPHAE